MGLGGTTIRAQFLGKFAEALLSTLALPRRLSAMHSEQLLKSATSQFRPF